MNGSVDGEAGDRSEAYLALEDSQHFRRGLFLMIEDEAHHSVSLHLKRKQVKELRRLLKAFLEETK